jgi:Domain of unknown function (DUF4352)
MRTIARLARGPRGLYFGLGLAVGLALAAHGVAASSVSTPCPRPAATTRPVAVPHPAHQAQLFVGGQHKWRLTLERVVVTAQIKGDDQTSHAQGKYVVVMLRAQNTGKVPQDLYLDQNFALRDAQGRRFSLDTGNADSAAREQYKLEYSTEDVQPTFSEHVAFVFDIARDAHGLALLNVPSFGGSTQKLFTLGV